MEGSPSTQAHPAPGEQPPSPEARTTAPAAQPSGLATHPRSPSRSRLELYGFLRSIFEVQQGGGSLATLVLLIFSGAIFAWFVDALFPLVHHFSLLLTARASFAWWDAAWLDIAGPATLLVGLGLLLYLNYRRNRYDAPPAVRAEDPRLNTPSCCS